MLTPTSLKKVLLSALTAIACMGFVPATPVQAQDDCGWVTDWNNPDGGYCSYHPEWYGGAQKSAAYSNAGSTYSSTTDGYAAPKAFTVYYQYSNPYEVIGNGNMRANGCVPTAAAMLGSYYGSGMTPNDWGWYLYSTGNFNNAYGHGGTDASWYDVAGVLGLTAWDIYDYDSLTSALQSGATVAIHAYYGGGTHAMLMTGYSNGMTTVYESIGGCYSKSVKSLWNSRSFVWNDCLTGSSVIALA